MCDSPLQGFASENRLLAMEWISHHCTSLLGIPLQPVLNKGLPDSYSDRVFRERLRHPSCRWSPGDFGLPQVPVPNRPPFLKVKLDCCSGQACRLTPEQTLCSPLSWIALSFPWPFSFHLSIRPACGGSCTRLPLFLCLGLYNVPAFVKVLPWKATFLFLFFLSHL